MDGRMGEKTGWDADKATLFICKTCRSADGTERPGASMIARLRENYAGNGTTAIRAVTCLSQCANPCAAALSRPDGFSYVFSGLGAGDLDDLLSGARMLAEDERGLLPFRDRPAALKRTLVARIPPFSHQEDIP